MNYYRKRIVKNFNRCSRNYFTPYGWAVVIVTAFLGGIIGGYMFNAVVESFNK